MTPQRCAWVNLNNPLYVTYHDEEWGVPIHDDIRLLEFIILESAQAGLSWETILNKREGYKKIFLGFDPKKIARLTKSEIKEMYTNPAIVRHKLKIDSVITNTLAFMAIQREFGSFDAYIWNWVQHTQIKNGWEKFSDVPTETEIAILLSKDLKKRGFKFFGPKICYAYMQAVGMVNDHTRDCFCFSKQ